MSDLRHTKYKAAIVIDYIMCQYMFLFRSVQYINSIHLNISTRRAGKLKKVLCRYKQQKNLIHNLYIYNIPHLIPYKVGQAPCKEFSDRRPLVSKLYQKAMEPLLGNVARPWFGNAVAPPSKSESCRDVIIEIMLSG